MEAEDGHQLREPSHPYKDKYAFFPPDWRPFHEYLAPAITPPHVNASPGPI